MKPKREAWVKDASQRQLRILTCPGPAELMCWFKKQRAFYRLVMPNDGQLMNSDIEGVRECTFSSPDKVPFTSPACPTPYPDNAPLVQAQVNFPSPDSKLPSSSAKIPRDVHQNAESSYLWVVKFEVIFTLFFMLLCIVRIFYYKHVSFLKYPEVVFQRQHHSPFVMCTFPGTSLLEKVSSFLLSLKFPMGTTQTQTSQRSSAKNHRRKYPTM